jgi:hypothetical protein
LPVGRGLIPEHDEERDEDQTVFVLGSHRPEGTPDHVVVETDAAQLLESQTGLPNGAVEVTYAVG